METTYDCLGLPLVFRSAVPLAFGAVLLLLSCRMRGYESSGLVVVLAFAGFIAIAAAVWMFVYTGRKIIVRDGDLGFVFLLAPTEWYSKTAVEAQVRTRAGRWPPLPAALRFIAPRPWYRPAILFEPSMLMTDDGRTVEYAQLEAAFGVAVTWPPN